MNIKIRIKSKEDMPPEVICNCPVIQKQLRAIYGREAIAHAIAHEATTKCIFCAKEYTGPHFCMLPFHSRIPVIAVDIDEGELN